MPVSVVVGGQYGSEGKGKVAHHLARARGASIAVRVGGPNSGHTVVDDRGRRLVLRQLPTAAILPSTICVLPPGSFIQVPLLLSEIFLSKLDKARLKIDPKAMVVGPNDENSERAARLDESIGSTLSGTGHAVVERALRSGRAQFAHSVPELAPYIVDTLELMNEHLQRDLRIVVEGTQGFGLSVLHGAHYPYATSRDCTAASCLSEAGLSPLSVDEVVLVIRAHPIRVSGNSGPLVNEITWEEVRREAGAKHDLTELTSVTKSVRRVARFDPEVVRRAILANRPSSVVMNHLDYVDARCSGLNELTPQAAQFVSRVEAQIGRRIDLLGTAPNCISTNLEKSYPLQKAR